MIWLRQFALRHGARVPVVMRHAALGTLAGLLSACASAPRPAPGDGVRAPAPASTAAATSQAPAQGQRRGGFYLDDGPGDAPPPNLDALPDAVPRVEPYHRFANRPYVVFGREYQPDLSDQPFRQRGMGSWYGRKFHGQRTSNGEIYDMYAMTAAHPTLPLPSYVRVVHAGNGRSVIVRVNDRGPFLHDRVIDLSYAAAHKLGYVQQGSAMLEVERLMPADILAGRIAPTTTMLAAGRPAPAPVMAHGSAGAAPVAAMPTGIAPPPAVVANAVDEGVIVNVVATPDLIVATALPAAPAGAATTRSATTAAPAGPPAATAGGTNTALGGGFMLQLGAFRNQAGADEFRTKLSARIASLGERLRVVPGSDFFRVQLGPYGERRDAEAAARELRSIFDFSPLVVPRR